jgi:hypothetical protein
MTVAQFLDYLASFAQTRTLALALAEVSGEHDRAVLYRAFV